MSDVSSSTEAQQKIYSDDKLPTYSSIGYLIHLNRAVHLISWWLHEK
jgi:hypothetical protein